MTQHIIARRSGSIKFQCSSENFDFDQDEFDSLINTGRELIKDLKADGINLKHDYGEDALCALITKASIELINELNINLVHVVYRILDKEIEENFQFSGSDIEFSED